METIQRYPLLKELEEKAFGVRIVEEETVRRDDQHLKSQEPNQVLDYTIQDGELGDDHLVEEHSENYLDEMEHNEYEDEEEPEEEEDEETDEQNQP